MAEAMPTERRLSGTGIVIEARAPLALINVRGDGGDPRFRRAVTSVADVAPPEVPNTSSTGLLASLLWLSPNEWLVVSDAQPGAALASRLQQALSGVHSAVTDVTDARCVFSLIGANVCDVLARGCSLDLDASVFPVSRCAQTLLAKTPILIHFRAPGPTMDVYVPRSFAGYAWNWLQTATQAYRDPA
jgi:sarcosine oxidase subunit gamma